MPSPNDELVDITDADGRVIGVVTRCEMREKRLPHRCTYVLVCDTQGRLFVHLRTPTKDVFPSHFDVAVGGVLAAGESFDAGARRELAEELGIAADPVPLFPFRYADERTVVHAMVYRLTHDGPFVYQPEEVVSGEFVPVEQVPQRIRTQPFCPDGVEVFKRYVQGGWQR